MLEFAGETRLVTQRGYPQAMATFKPAVETLQIPLIYDPVEVQVASRDTGSCGGRGRARGGGDNLRQQVAVFLVYYPVLIQVTEDEQRREALLELGQKVFGAMNWRISGGSRRHQCDGESSRNPGLS